MYIRSRSARNDALSSTAWTLTADFAAYIHAEMFRLDADAHAAAESNRRQTLD